MRGPKPLERVEEPLAFDFVRSVDPERAGSRWHAWQSGRNVERLLRARWGALTPFYIEKTLRGEDHFYSRQTGKMEPLWPELVNSAVFGSMPSLKRADLAATIIALETTDKLRRVADDPPRYRYAEHVRTEEARAARAAAQLVQQSVRGHA